MRNFHHKNRRKAKSGKIFDSFKSNCSSLDSILIQNNKIDKTLQIGNRKIKAEIHDRNNSMIITNNKCPNNSLQT